MLRTFLTVTCFLGKVWCGVAHQDSPSLTKFTRSVLQLKEKGWEFLWKLVIPKTASIASPGVIKSPELIICVVFNNKVPFCSGSVQLLITDDVKM